MPFADEPHWDSVLDELTDAEKQYVAEHVDRPPSADEIGEAYADVSLDGVFKLFETERSLKVMQVERGAQNAHAGVG